tara:strand:+ start:297 stop:722 length:426 start_codon:yes stop_codon:yes gene_type:complete
MQAVKYFAFAIVCTVLNLGTQFWILEWIDHSRFGLNDYDYILTFAIVCGTFVGLVSKFLLDKFYVFMDPRENIRDEASKFFVYSSLGIITTLVFWAVEWSFYILWKNPMAKYLGGALGLGVGYCLKYVLDRRFVFNRAGYR